MPRKSKPIPPAETAIIAESSAPIETPSPEEPNAARNADLSAEPFGPNEKPKNWGPPYKPIYTNVEKGYELGEDRRFKQRVFKFKEKPDEQTLAALKEAGFRFRAEDKSWTIQADAASRELSDRLAKQLAGPSRTR